MSDKIKVVVKVRPLIAREIEDKLTNHWLVKDNTIHQLDQNGKDVVQSFTFDKVYNIETNTNDVYNDIAKPIVEAAVRGINGTIFAYGQTSSGKTYTMTGTEDSPGIVQLAVHDLFNLIKNIPDRDFLLRVSYIELYNECINDLLDIERKNVKIHFEGHQSGQSGHGIKVDILEKVITTPTELFDVMKEGEANRKVGETNMNKESSRSHSIFQIVIESRAHCENPEEEGNAHVSQLNLVDLAGSERAGQTGATGKRFKEGTHINKSLSVLGLVIKQLSEQANFISYRDSKLTRILQNSLGGNANTSIVCAVTPASIEETVSTLQFASRAKLIENKPVVNEVHTNETKIQELTKQLAQLQMKLESTKSIEHDNKVLMKKIKALRRQILNGSYIERPVASSKPRRATICATTQLQTIHEQPIPQRPILIVPKFEPIRDTKVTISEDVIEIESDDDNPPINTPCSPRHKCYAESKTPPCVLKEKVKRAEQSCREIAEMAKLEKIYSPSIIELKEEIQTKDSLINDLEEKVKNLTDKCEEHERNVLKLSTDINKRDVDIDKTKNAFKLKCDNLDTKIAEWELSYETLKKKFKCREEELLSRIEEKDKYFKQTVKTPIMESAIVNFLDMSKDITLHTSDDESSITDNAESKKTHIDIETQINKKDILIKELEQEIESQKIKITSHNEENALLKITVDTLNSTIKSQKNSLDTLTNDIMSCNDAIKEIKSINNEETLIDGIIGIEDRLTINNEHIKLLVNDFRNCLADKNKEIRTLKKQNNAADVKFTEADNKFKVIIEEKEKALSKVETELLDIKEKIKENQEQLAKLLKENEILLNNNNTVSEQLATVEDKNKCLQSQLEEVITQKDKEIKELIDNNENTNNKLMQKEVNVQEILTGNEDLRDQITKLNNVIKNLEKENNNQQSLILTLSQNKRSQDSSILLKLLIDKTKDMLSNLISTENFEININSLDDDALLLFDNYMTKATTAVINLLSEKRDIVENIENLTNELRTIKEKNLLLQQISKDNEILTQKYNKLSDELQETNTTLEVITLENDDLQIKINELENKIGENNYQLADKENEINTLNKKINHINTEKENIEIALKMKESEYDEIRQKLDNYNDQSADKYKNRISELEERIVEINNEIQRCKKEIDTRNSLLVTFHCNIGNLSKALTGTSLVKELSLEQIPDFIVDVNNYIENLKLQLTTETNTLIKEQEELKDIRHNKNKLEEEYTKLTDKYHLACKTIETLQSENKNSNDNLLNIKNTLECLQTENSLKTEQINNFLRLMETHKHDLQKVQIENDNLKVSQVEKNNKIKKYEEMLLHSVSGENKLVEVNIPHSLSKICVNKIMNIFTEESQTGVITSDPVVKTEIITKKMCDCDKVIKTINRVHSENESLKHNVSKLTALNENLSKEIGDGRNEISLLIEETKELNKKILNDRASVSTFSATTYAENKLLRIQMKALLHHHTRMHNIFQRDITDMKAKLATLQRILQNDPNYASCLLNNSFKRYSWPNAFPFNTSLGTLKNESNVTLDSDLLMLDTNITLTTAYNSTLVQDQTCHSMTQLNVEAECDEARKTDCILMTDNIYEELDRLVEENQNLKKQVEQLSDKNNKLKIYEDEGKPCAKCDRQDELKVEIEILRSNAKDYETLSVKLKEITFEKDDIESKYNNIVTKVKALDIATCKVQELENNVLRLQDRVSEITTEKNDIEENFKILLQETKSSDNLQRKVQNLEKDCDKKSKDIAKLMETLKNNDKQLEKMQQEYDILSTELMDNISESDFLKKEIEHLKTKEVQNTKAICTECDVKDKIIESLVNKNETKLNKSVNTSLTDKYCTLRNEICASREDCNMITKEVETMKNHLERSNMSIGQPMDLDESMPDTNVMPLVALNSLEHYVSDKRECIEFLILKTSTKHEYNEDVKLIEMMRHLYEFLINKHGTEVENLNNKINNFEESQKTLQLQLDDINGKHKDLHEQLANKDQIISKFSEVIKRMKQNIDDINSKISVEENMTIVSMFKENVLCAFDENFLLPISPIFNIILNNIATKHQTEITDMTEQYELLQSKMEGVLSELKTVNDTLTQTKIQLKEMKEQYYVLGKERDEIQEISTNVNAELIKRDNEINELVKESLNLLLEKGIVINNVEVEYKSSKESLLEVFAYIKESMLCDTKRCEELESELSVVKTNLDEKDDKLILCEKEIMNLKEDIDKKEKHILEQDIIITKVDNQTSENVTLLLCENNKLKEDLIKNKQFLTEKEAEIHKIMARINAKEEEVKALRDMHNIVIEERDLYNSELTDAGIKLKECDENNKAIVLEMEKLKQDLMEKTTIINELNMNTNKLFDECQSLKCEKQSLFDKVTMCEGELGNKIKEIQQLQLNIKTIEKSAEIQNNIIKRITKEKEDITNERDKKIMNLTNQLQTLKQTNEALAIEIKDIKSRQDDFANYKFEKRDSLKRDSIEHMSSECFEKDRRERRRSIFDTNRTLAASQDDVEAVFAERAEPIDLFPEKSDSDRSTPTNKRLSSLPRNEQDGDADRKRMSLSESISATRRRRQSIHDLHRTSLHIQLSDDEKLKAKAGKSLEDSDKSSLQSELESCRRELSDLRARYEELDEECETCAKYLEERNEQCYALNADKLNLEKQVSELSEQLEKFMKHDSSHVLKAHVAVNTDEDWSNLHAVVVDRMSYDAEVEKNKKLTRALEEFHIKNRDLKCLVEKYEKKLKSVANSQELSRVRSELSKYMEQCKLLEQRVDELDHECDACAAALKQAESNCYTLQDNNAMLQSRITELSAALDKCTCAHNKRTSNSGNNTQECKNRQDDFNMSVDEPDILDELRQKNKELQHKLAKLQKKIDRDSFGREMDAINDQLVRCKAENCELVNRCRILNEKCDERQMLLNEKEEQCNRLNEHKLRLEEKVGQLQELTDKSMSSKIKRRSIHDQQREIATNTDTCESAMALEIQQLKKQIETMKHSSKTMYVETGSAIVQNQKISDIMRENQKLMKTNEKLVQLCKKRGKQLSNEDRENLRPAHD